MKSLRKVLLRIIISGITGIMLISTSTDVSAQCQPYIKVDGNIVIANQTVATGLTLPLWLKEGQSIAVSQMVNSISILEFTINGTTLEFSQVLSITSNTAQFVPAGKVWKVESIVKQPTAGNNNQVNFLMPGTSSFTVPSCAEYICIEVWGGGGGGQGSAQGGGGGGGGGAYGQGCFTVSPGSSHTVIVGAGGSGGSGNGTQGQATSVGTLISAGGGLGGNASGGNGGTSTAPVSISGFKGEASLGTGSSYGRNGGYGGNGGAGGINNGYNAGVAGTAPGGGGSGAGSNSGYSGGAGAAGRVIITW